MRSSAVEMTTSPPGMVESGPSKPARISTLASSSGVPAGRTERPARLTGPRYSSTSDFIAAYGGRGRMLSGAGSPAKGPPLDVHQAAFGLEHREHRGGDPVSVEPVEGLSECRGSKLPSCAGRSSARIETHCAFVTPSCAERRVASSIMSPSASMPTTCWKRWAKRKATMPGPQPTSMSRPRPSRVRHQPGRRPVRRDMASALSHSVGHSLRTVSRPTPNRSAPSDRRWGACP